MSYLRNRIIFTLFIVAFSTFGLKQVTKAQVQPVQEDYAYAVIEGDSNVVEVRSLLSTEVRQIILPDTSQPFRVMRLGQSPWTAIPYELQQESYVAVSNLNTDERFQIPIDLGYSLSTSDPFYPTQRIDYSST